MRARMQSIINNLQNNLRVFSGLVFIAFARLSRGIESLCCGKENEANYRKKRKLRFAALQTMKARARAFCNKLKSSRRL